jgi:GMP synthase (glutamine-hydrolysing)
VTDTKPIMVLNAGPNTQWPLFHAACGGDNDVLFAASMGIALEKVMLVDLEQAAQLPAAETCAGVVISGSASMVTDRLPWSERAAAWIRENRDRVPMLGVCFGHQLIAHALGGRVDWSATGPEYGTIAITTTALARGDALFQQLPGQFLAQSAHHQTVTKLPAGSVTLAEGSSGIQAARFGRQTWGVQFHPEYSREQNRVLLEVFRDGLAEGGVDVDAMLGTLGDSGDAARVLGAFAATCGHVPKQHAAAAIA